jgi:ribosomal protein S18 acetylase RimI-like enzyme
MVEIIGAESQDLEEILALQKLAYVSEALIFNDFNIPPMRQTIEDMYNEFSNQTILKAVLDGKIVGSVRAYQKDGTCFIGKLIVHPEQQNKGIGRQLLSQVEVTFNAAARFELFTGQKSEKNLYLYQKQGYKVFDCKKVNENLSFVYLEKLNQ